MGQIKNIKLHIVTDIKVKNKIKRMVKASRNSDLEGGISKLSRSAVYRKRGLYKRKKAGAVAAVKVAEPTTKVKPIGGDKNGGERTVPLVKQPRFYPTEDIKNPLRRVPQSYVIGTQTKVDISGCTAEINPAMFKREKKAKAASEMFEESADGYSPSEEKKALQEQVDESILAEISKEPHLRKYMEQLFTLRKKQFPHEMVF